MHVVGACAREGTSEQAGKWSSATYRRVVHSASHPATCLQATMAPAPHSRRSTRPPAPHQPAQQQLEGAAAAQQRQASGGPRAGGQGALWVQPRSGRWTTLRWARQSLPPAWPWRLPLDAWDVGAFRHPCQGLSTGGGPAAWARRGGMRLPAARSSAPARSGHAPALPRSAGGCCWRQPRLAGRPLPPTALQSHQPVLAQQLWTPATLLWMPLAAAAARHQEAHHGQGPPLQRSSRAAASNPRRHRPQRQHSPGKGEQRQGHQGSSRRTLPQLCRSRRLAPAARHSPAVQPRPPLRTHQQRRRPGRRGPTRAGASRPPRPHAQPQPANRCSRRRGTSRLTRRALQVHSLLLPPRPTPPRQPRWWARHPQRLKQQRPSRPPLRSRPLWVPGQPMEQQQLAWRPMDQPAQRPCSGQSMHRPHHRPSSSQHRSKTSSSGGGPLLPGRSRSRLEAARRALEAARARQRHSSRRRSVRAQSSASSSRLGMGSTLGLLRPLQRCWGACHSWSPSRACCQGRCSRSSCSCPCPSSSPCPSWWMRSRRSAWRAAPCLSCLWSRSPWPTLPALGHHHPWPALSPALLVEQLRRQREPLRRRGRQSSPGEYRRLTPG